MTAPCVPHSTIAAPAANASWRMPQGGFTRGAQLAKLPLGIAGRAVRGAGQRMTGLSAERVQAELAEQTAEQLFAVLGRLKGGAMKFGQALSVFEAALPESLAAPYRESLTKLQDGAPAMPTDVVHRVLAEQFGRDWRGRFLGFDDAPRAAASIGQVHHAVWQDGREVAVKVQYPGAGPALLADFKQLAFFARLIGGLFPALELKPLLAELRRGIELELDYSREASAQRVFAAAYRDDPNIVVPRVLASAPKVLVSEWIEGRSLATVIASGTAADRDRAGRLLALLQFSSPARAGLLHADPHPGNFRLLPDGRLGVLDFGAAVRLPDGMPSALGRFTRLILTGDAAAVETAMRAEGFVRPGSAVDVALVIDFLRPVVEPLGADDFTFSREWLRGHVNRIGADAGRVCRMLNLPPEYLMLHRVTLGTLGILCQLGATAPYRQLAEEWQPGFDAA